VSSLTNSVSLMVNTRLNQRANLTVMRRVRAHKIPESFRWMGLFIVEVTSLQEKAECGGENLPSSRRRRGSRGKRSGRARGRQPRCSPDRAMRSESKKADRRSYLDRRFVNFVSRNSDKLLKYYCYSLGKDGFAQWSDSDFSSDFLATYSSNLLGRYELPRLDYRCRALLRQCAKIRGRQPPEGYLTRAWSVKLRTWKPVLGLEDGEWKVSDLPRGPPPKSHRLARKKPSDQATAVKRVNASPSSRTAKPRSRGKRFEHVRELGHCSFQCS